MDDASGAALGDAIYVMGGTDNYTVFNHVFVSHDNGVNWQKLPNAPWQERNAMCIAGNVNGKIKMWGGNNNEQAFRDAWEFDPEIGWKKIADDMGDVYGDRFSFAYVYTGREFIVMGGYNHTDVVVSNDLKSWKVRSQLPAEIQHTGGITACYFNGSIFLTSGRNRLSGNYPGKVFRSDDGGATWQVVYDDASEGTDIFSNKWGNIVATKTAMIYIKGTTGETGGTNEKGCYVSIDGAHWQRMMYEPAARHATTVFASSDGRDAYMVMGNFHNDSWLFRQVDDGTQTAVLDSNCVFELPVFSSEPNSRQVPAAGAVVSGTPGDSLGVQIFTAVNGHEILANSFQLVLSDTLAPVVEPLADTVLYAGRNCTWSLPDFTALIGVKENCGNYTILQTPVAGTAFSSPADSLQVQIVVRDDAGNESLQNFRVILADTSGPEIEMPQTLDLENTPGSCGAVADIQKPQVKASCSSVELHGSRSDGLQLQDSYPVGETMITWKAINSTGYSDTALQMVIVKDVEKPAIQIPEELEFCPNTNNVYELPLAEVSDNCSVASVTYTISGATERDGSGVDASGYFSQGISYINWNVTDAAGNVSQATTRVRVRRLLASVSAAPPVFPGAEPNTLYQGFGPDSLLLTASVENGRAPFAYEWNTGESGSDLWVHTSAGSATYTVYINDAAGCSDTAAIAITVKDIRCGENRDKVSLCVLQDGRLTSLCAEKAEAENYFTSGALPGICAGNFPQITEHFSVESTENKLHILAAPNPTVNAFSIRVESFVREPVHFRLYNAIGAMVKEITVMPGREIRLGEALAPGLYILQASQGREVKTRKLLKKKN